MGRALNVALAAACTVAAACTAAHPATRSIAGPGRPSSVSPAAEPRFAPFDAAPGRRSFLPPTTASGSRVIRLQRYVGDYEIQFQCLGTGAAVYQLDGIARQWQCGQPILDEETTTRRPLASLSIRAARSQRWQVLVQAGHTPMG